MITKLAIAGYRSLRDIRLSLGPLNVVTGANGSGKSSLYRAVRLRRISLKAASFSRSPEKVACSQRSGPARNRFHAR